MTAKCSVEGMPLLDAEWAGFGGVSRKGWMNLVQQGASVPVVPEGLEVEGCQWRPRRFPHHVTCAAQMIVGREAGSQACVRTSDIYRDVPLQQ